MSTRTAWKVQRFSGKLLKNLQKGDSDPPLPRLTDTGNTDPVLGPSNMTISGNPDHWCRQQKGGPRRDLLSPRIRSRCQDELDFVTSVGLWRSGIFGRASQENHFFVYDRNWRFQSLEFVRRSWDAGPHGRHHRRIRRRGRIRRSQAIPLRAQRDHLSAPSRSWWLRADPDGP